MTYVFKYGGHALPKRGEIDPTIEYLSKLIKSGEKIVVVHGGGPQINKELEIHGVASEMVGGFRVTTPEVFEVVERTLSGEVLRNIVSSFIGCGVNAVGLSSGDGGLIRAKVKDPSLGLVGEIDEVNPKLIIQLLDNGFTPIISPVGVNSEGQGLNLNADLVAGAIGGSLGADCVYFATDVAGIYRNWPDSDSRIEAICVEELEAISVNFDGGMVPKSMAVVNAIRSGSKSARIFDGRNVSNVEMAISGKVGTLVVP